MKPILLRLTDEQYDVLRALAFEQRVSMAELVRRAISRVYGEDIEDILDMEKELAEYHADPNSAMDFEEYVKARESGVPR